MKVLVTGGAGFIGGIVGRRLRERGHEVEVLDNLSTGSLSAVPPGAPLHRIDITHQAAVGSVLERGFDAVFHLAAALIVEESFSRPEHYSRTNIGGTENLVWAMRNYGCERLVFSSTAAVYAQAAGGQLAESAPVAPVSPYGETKLACDRLISEASGDGLRATSLRYFNVCAASHGLGETRPHETHLIPLAFDAATGHRPVLEIYGTDYPTADGTAVRDYVHVADVADAHVAAFDNLPASGHQIYNLGSERGHSVAEVIHRVEQVTGLIVPTVDRPRRRGDPPVLIADGTRARRELGWRAARSTLSQIIGDTWRWRQSGRGAAEGPL